MPPKRLQRWRRKSGFPPSALTDHDTIDGLAEFQAAGNALGIEAIAGIEFAALWEHFHRPEIHIVGLGFDPAHPVLKGRMETIRSSRDIRNRRMCERLSSIGLHLTLDEVAANAGGEIITRAHFANILLEKGYIKKKADCFYPYISPVCRAMWSGNFSLLPFASKPSRRQAARRFWRILRFMSWM